MPDEAKVPERIWASPELDDHFSPPAMDWSTGLWDLEKGYGDDAYWAEYVRADIARQEADARVAVAYQLVSRGAEAMLEQARREGFEEGHKAGWKKAMDDNTPMARAGLKDGDDV